MQNRVRVFVSSPGDVPDERLRSELVVDKLAQEYGRFFVLETYRWEYEPMLASGHFQDVIEPPSTFDIVVLILWSRLGTPLPEKTPLREYRGLDGDAPVTGTQWEFEEALNKARVAGAPDLLAFRRTSPAPVDPTNPEARRRANAQMDALDAFWRRHFEDKGMFLAASSKYRNVEEFSVKLEQVLRKLIERRIKLLAAAIDAQAPIWIGAPFRGLKVYEFAHAPIFFGRDGVVTKAAELLAKHARSGTAFLMLVGNSGSGKSSLVRAALVPRLMRPQRIEGTAFIRRVIFRPGDGGGDLILALVEALTQRSPDGGVGVPELLAFGQQANDLAVLLRQAADAPGFVFANALGHLTEVGRSSGRLLAHEAAKLILVVDQFEEVFTKEGISAAERTLFVRLLRGFARSGAIWVVATMRGDFWHRAGEIAELIELTADGGRLDVLPPTPAKLGEMIRKPAQVAGLSFETHPQTHLGLDSVLAEDAASEPGVLPLLSFTLDALCKEDVETRAARVLSFSTYESLGGLKGAIASEAEKTVAALPAAAQSAVPRVLRTLATIGGSERIAVTRAVPMAGFAEGSGARAVVDTLIAARLLTAATEGPVATVRLAHEALLTHWQRARDQLTADHRDLETRALIESQHLRSTRADAAARKQLLLRDPDLARAVDLKHRWGDELAPELAAFIDASARAATAAARRRRAIAAAAIIWLVAAIGALLLAETQRNNALIAQSRALARDAQAGIADGDTTLAALLALHALPQKLTAPDRPFVNEAAYALENALANRRDLLVLAGDGGAVVTSAAFSPDGTRLVTASRNGTAQLWDGETGKPIAVLKGHQAAIVSALFSPDGGRVITASRDATARVWDAATGATTAVLRGHTQIIRSVAISPDGLRIATASDDTTTRLWDAKTGATIAVLRGHHGPVNSVAFSPDGKRLVTAEWNNVAGLWDAATGAAMATLAGHLDAVWSAAFSPDGLRIVTASRDGTARLWEGSTGAMIAVLRGHGGQVYSATFSPDGKRVLTGSEDRTAWLWNAETATVVAMLRGNEGVITAAVFSPDGARVLTASTGKAVKLWSARSGDAIATLVGHEDAVTSAAFSPDGRRVATASTDGTARLWRVDIAAMSGVLRGHRSYVYHAAFSPDGRRIATASADKTVRVWDAASAKELTAPLRHDDEVWFAEFSPDGRSLASASEDKIVRLWDAASGALRAELPYGKAGVLSLAFSPDGSRLVAGSEDNAALLWDASTNSLLGEFLPPHAGKVNSVTYSPDGTRVVTASADHTARLWDAGTRALIRTFDGHEETVNSVAMSRDGGQIATASADKTVRLWDLKSGAVTNVIRADHAINSATFSPDGKRLVIADWGGNVGVFDAGTGAKILSLPGHGDTVWSASFSPDAGRLVTASEDMTARLWTLPPHCQDLIEAASKALPRALSSAERARFFLEDRPGNVFIRIYGVLRPWIAWALPRAGDRCE